MRHVAWTPLVLAGLATAALAQKQLHTHIGTTNQENLGNEIRAAGDVDGDGLGDYVLGVSAADPNGSSSGQARIYSGATGLLIRAHDGPSAGASFGHSVAGLGDLNGDGRSEVIVGAVAVNGAAGAATVYSGIDGSVLYALAGFTAGDRFGQDVALIGDVDLDSTPDFAVGASRDNTGPNGTSGAVHVFSGATGGLLYSKFGDDHLDEFGTAVRGAGDVNGDGRPDIVVGATRDDNAASAAGVVHMLSGLDGSTLWRASGNTANDYLGELVDGAGADMNGDGVPDVIAATDNADYVQVLSGANGALIREVDSTYSGGGGPDFGRGACALGDVDGDGRGDYCIGDSTAYVLGQVRVFSGATGDEIYVITWTNQNHGFGRHVGNVGDLNGDGRDEFGVGAPGFDFAGIGNTGRVAIYSPQAPIGARYCSPATVGSSGRAGIIQAYGSAAIGDECFSLTVVGLPVATFGYFIAGTAQNSVMPGGSIGTICIGGMNVARFNSMDKVIRGPGGSIEVDLLAIPGNPPRPVMPGETWNFQCWFRDSTSAGTATSNFSDAIGVLFN